MEQLAQICEILRQAQGELEEAGALLQFSNRVTWEEERVELRSQAIGHISHAELLKNAAFELLVHLSPDQDR